ncbi:bacillithiol biosynthesis cysteine-adding enzyme BshC [Alteribacillus sp. YIM 98480]|uniref:bacillithiol biosynthesis cysteine-adding enzyme BshC n=1 Tax=Alteribacillus sp. YIM 98480 TaxID=2606599 RepID=UPI00131CFFF1|nr:bacillithiol biosynthesis cysteine-adding enzyme BshC [Alteribacillus sp. YIM 98480]
MDVFESYFPHPNAFVKDYKENIEQAASFFDYGLSDDEIHRRSKELKERSFDKKALYHHLHTYNSSFLYNEKALEEIEKLKDSNAVMVVTGQQAGLAAGPLYTISKAITTLKQAQKQEKHLGIPVLPVFWIAGEDHDWEEVNHIFLPGSTSLKKFTYKGPFRPGVPVSEQTIEEDAIIKWWIELKEYLPETNHTKGIYYTLKKLAGRSYYYTDFFGEVMRWLFRDTGLIMLDAHNPNLRALEKDTFASLIKNHKTVQEAVEYGRKNREAAEYPLPEGLPQEGVHLFYHYRSQRHLLFERDSQSFTDKKGRAVFYKEELLDSLSSSPVSFSANVFTRPLVQEKLLPVLTFIAGPGEINYWSMLQPLFHSFHVKVPPVYPRYEFTFIPRRIQSILRHENLSAIQFLNGEADKIINRLQERAKKVDGGHMADVLLSEISPYHAKMREEWERLNPSEKSFGDKNWSLLKKNIMDLAKKIDGFQENQEQCRLQKIRKTAQLLCPLNRPQERVFNILYFVNKSGDDFVSRLNTLEFSETVSHKIINL